MSLRYRLNLIIIVICFLALILGSAISVINARDSVYEEVSSTLNLAKKLLGGEVADKQILALDNVRHLKVSIMPNHKILPDMNELNGVPEVFVQFVRPTAEKLSLLLESTRNDNSLRLLADPMDEIKEAWDETLIFISTLLLLTLFIAVSVFFVIGQTLRPVNDILLILTEIEQGKFSKQLAHFNLPEFDRIANGVNHLSHNLALAKSDNRRLIKKALNVRELERRHLAREMHDEMGQSLSAIKALSVSVKRNAQVDSELLNKIESICDYLFTVVRNRMRQLSPPLLSEFGLTVSINELVDEWQGNAAVTIELDDKLDEFVGSNGIHVYRIVQEALTNVLKHSRAACVWIQLKIQQSATDNEQRLFVLIKDDGVGFNPSDVRWGGGLVGIRERVESLAGELKILSSMAQGTTLSAYLLMDIADE